MSGPPPPDGAPPPADPWEGAPGDPLTAWVGSAAVPPSDRERELRRRFVDETLDLPLAERPGPAVPVTAVPVTAVPVPYRPPPVYNPPPPAPPAPPARRRKWPWVLLIMAMLCTGCCGGCALWVRPFLQQYPATASTTATVTGLTIVDDKAATRTAQALLKRIGTEQIDEQRFTIVYADANNAQRKIMLAGTTRFVGDPAKDLDAALDRLTPDLALTNRRQVAPGPLGGQQRCGTGKLDGRVVSVCAWADHGSVAVAAFLARDVDASSVMLQAIRAAVIQRG